MTRDHTPARIVSTKRFSSALDELRRGLTTRHEPDGSVTVAIELGHTLHTRSFASADEFERHGLDALTGLVRDALVALLTGRQAHTTDMGMGSIEDELGDLEEVLSSVDVLSTQAFRVEDLPLVGREHLEPVDPVQSVRVPANVQGTILTPAPTSTGETRSGHATTVIDQAELHRRLHGTPTNLRAQDIERAHATLVPGNYETASLGDLHGQRLIDAILQGMTSHGYPEALVVEVAPGRISIQLQAGLPAVITPTQHLRENLMGTLADTIMRARKAGAMPRR